jgi:hypothetical protein
MRFLLLAILLLCPFACSADDWGAMQYLVGNWTGEGGGAPGQGVGGFSFEPDLHGKILVRKSRAEYPATKDRPAFEHDDLMIVYRELDDRAEGAPRAIFFDNEDHVIRYDITMFGDRIIFTSEPVHDNPQYRLTYTRVNADSLRIKFEIALPGKGFATYLDGSAKRAK